MDKKTILGFVIIALILILTPFYTRFVSPPKENIPVETADTLSHASNESNNSTDDAVLGSHPEPESEENVTFSGTTTVDTLDSMSLKIADEVDVHIVTNEFDIVINTRGADIRSLKLNNYTYHTGENIEMIPPDSKGANFDINLFRGSQTIESSSIVFSVDTEELILNEQDSIASIIFTSSGMTDKIQRIYTFHYNGFLIGHELRIEPEVPENYFDQNIIWWRNGLYPTEKNVKGDLMAFKYSQMMGDELEREKYKKKKPISQSPDGQTEYVCSQSKYFLVLLAPESGFADGARASSISRPVWIADKQYDVPAIGIGLFFKNSDEIVSQKHTLIVGPSDHNALAAINTTYGDAVDLGWSWLRPITKFMLWLFSFLFSIIPNYGIVILLFTLIMKLVLLPLSSKQLKSARDMQRLQPQIKELKDRYTDNPEKLNSETMALYKKAGVNPLGGCLPLFFQMPIFFALYRALSMGFQFRAAPFAFWLKDLSSPDPIFILPIVMAVTMFVQQKMTITDPKQKMMVYMMPIMMLFLFRNMPAGLVLYWTFFNMLTVAHTMWMRREPTDTKLIESK